MRARQNDYSTDLGPWSIYAALCDMYMFNINVHKYKLPNPRISLASVYLHLNWKHWPEQVGLIHEKIPGTVQCGYIPDRKMSLNSTFVMALTSIF